MPAAKKIDLYKLHKDEYVAPKRPTLVDVRPAVYLAVVGCGEPGGEAFTTNMGALFAIAYTCKFVSKAAGRDYAVCKPEAQWWGTNERLNFSTEPREKWNWKLLIRTPEFVTARDVAKAAKQLRDKGKGPEVERVKRETIREGRCVQMLHVGPYDREVETIAEMQRLAEERGLAFSGFHHEIYLSDPRRVAPERLRTILRMPVG